MNKTVLLATAAAVALSVGGVASAAGQRTTLTSKGSHAVAHRVIGHTPGSVTLYDQNVGDGLNSILSQNFTGAGNSIYDSQGADDFTVPAGHRWTIKEVDVTGVYFNGSGPATGENVFFYRAKGGLPGKIVATCSNVQGADSGGSFAIKLSKAACGGAVRLKGGRGGKTYFVTVEANLGGVQDGSGEWGWTTNVTGAGNPAAWQNQGGAFGICPSWAPLLSCIPSAGGPDFAFALQGRSS